MEDIIKYTFIGKKRVLIVEIICDSLKIFVRKHRLPMLYTKGQKIAFTLPSKDRAITRNKDISLFKSKHRLTKL